MRLQRQIQGQNDETTLLNIYTRAEATRSCILSHLLNSSIIPCARPTVGCAIRGDLQVLVALVSMKRPWPAILLVLSSTSIAVHVLCLCKRLAGWQAGWLYSAWTCLVEHAVN